MQVTFTFVLAFHVLVAAAAIVVGRRRPRAALLVGGLGPLAAVVWLAAASGTVLGGEAITGDVAWVDGLAMRLAFRVDALALLMGWLIAGIGVAVFWYAHGYFDDGRGRLGAFTATLVLFAGSMLGLVVADDVFSLFLFWELTSVTSFLLIGYGYGDDGSRASAMQALLTTATAGLALLAGLVLLALEAGTSSLSAWLADPPRGPTVPAALVLVFIGAAAKSAQFPLHFWLPGAMAAPTPVSAYLHSATMVKAGVYLVARLAPMFAPVAVWRPMVLGVGAVTMLFGGVVALRRWDLKQVLAYGTVSQLGFLVVLVGAGVPSLTTAGVAMLLAHGVFKAALFMVVGVVDHATGTRDLRRLGGLGRSEPVLAATAVLAGASMAGIPPLLGFVTKEKALDSLLHVEAGWAVPLLAVVVVGSTLTVAYTTRLLWRAFARPLDAAAVAAVHHRPAVAFLAPGAVLAVAGLAAGVAPALVNRLVVAAGRAADPGAGGKGLALWHGINTALVVSGVVIVAGVALGRAVERVPAAVRLPAGWRGEHLFSATVSGVLRGAERVTRIVQPGSLPYYLLVVAMTVVVLPGGALLFGGWRWPATVVVADTPVQVVAAVAVATAAVAVTVVRHRMAAALSLGAVGFGVAVLFVVEGAPDLALTQLLVETVALLAFVLVLRHLPRHYPRPAVEPRFARSRQAGRLAVAAGVGLVMAGLAVSAGAGRTGAPAAVEALERSLPDGGGRNTVNVILADFRALDTIGEITVLAVAVVAVMALVGADVGRRAREQFRPSLPLGVGTELIFHTVVVFALYLLLAGHNRPGGGFVAGLVAGAAFVVRYLATGRVDVRLRRVRPEALVGSGVLLAAVTAAAPLLAGRPLFEATDATFTLPLFGPVKVTTVLLFEVAVLVVVLGLTAGTIRGLGEVAAAEADDDTGERVRR